MLPGSKRRVIAIEARIPDPATAGGVGQVIMSLAKNLSELEEPAHDYVFVGLENARGWLGKYIGGPCRLHIVPSQQPRPTKGLLARSPLAPWLEQREARRRAEWLGRWAMSILPYDELVPRSDGTVESLGADVVHFPWQSAYLTKVPSIYHPHDLQHLHMPEFFDAMSLRVRLVVYRACAAQARFICVETQWIEQDVVNKLDVAPDKVVVIPVAPPPLPAPAMDSDAAQSARRMAGFPRFVFYPAQTWRHKNHIRLLEALALLKTRWGIVVPLVCSGAKNDFFPQVEAKIAALGLAEQTRFIGFVSDDELSALYRLATAVVVPTKFESLSLPVWEAFAAGTPVACSRVTSLPEQIDDAGLLFDADDPEEMALAVKRLWEDEALRKTLAAKGLSRVQSLSERKMAEEFRALYDRACDTPEPEGRS